MTREPRIPNVEKTVFLINGIAQTGYEELNWTLLLYHSEKLTVNELKT